MGADLTAMEIKRFIIETLALEDLSPEDIADDLSLFEGGLGLDSIDTLELWIALRTRFSLELDDTTSLRDRLGTVRAIAEFLAGASLVPPRQQPRAPLAG